MEMDYERRRRQCEEAKRPGRRKDGGGLSMGRSWYQGNSQS